MAADRVRAFHGDPARPPYSGSQTTALERLREPRAGPPTKIALHGFRKDCRDLIAWFAAKSRRTDGMRKGCRPAAPFGNVCEALLGLATGGRGRRANRAVIQAEDASGRTSASLKLQFRQWHRLRPGWLGQGPCLLTRRRRAFA